MIAISDLVKRYGTFTDVDGVSLEAKGGEIHGFLGPNGAGKTTTIRMIAGLLKPTAGRIVVNDHDLATNPVGPGVARVHPRPSVHLRKADGRRVSAISRGALRHQRHSVGPRVHEMLDLFKLGDWEQEFVESFSHGMKQRLVMSAAFLHRPDAVLVDEPMVGLDPRGARLIKHVFRRMSEHGVAILMSTHTLEVAQEMCDRISIIVKGKIIAERGRAAGAGRRRGPAAHPRVPEADRRQRSAGDRRRCLVRAPWRPFRICCCRRNWSSVNRARRREPGDLLRTAVFGAIGIGVMAALFFGAVWLTLQLDGYDELGDFLLRLGLSWLFLTFLSFLAFSGVVTALSTFFLSDDLRVAARRAGGHAAALPRAVRAHRRPVLLDGGGVSPAGLGRGGCGAVRAGGLLSHRRSGHSAVRRDPGRLGGALTLLLVNVFPARRAREILMFMGLLFAASIVLLLRYVQPERLLRVESLPDITGFFATLQSPVTPMLPSFWAGETLFAGLQGGYDLLHGGALWTTALGLASGGPLRASGRRSCCAPPTSAGTSPGSARRRRHARRASPASDRSNGSRAGCP